MAPGSGNKRRGKPWVLVAVLFWEIFYNVVEGTLQQLTKKVQGVRGHGISGLHAAYGGATDSALDLKRIGCCATQFHGVPQWFVRDQEKLPPCPLHISIIAYNGDGM